MQTSAPLIALVGGGAGELRVEAEHRGGLGDVERLSVRHALDHVEQHHVAEFLEAGEKGERAADLTGADERDLGSGHVREPHGMRRAGPENRALDVTIAIDAALQAKATGASRGKLSTRVSRPANPQS